MMNNKLIVIALIAIVFFFFRPTVEHAAGSPGALIQLATSSPYMNNTWVRPVRQRGMHFNNPSWNRFDVPTLGPQADHRPVYRHHNQRYYQNQPGLVPEQIFPWIIVAALVYVIWRK